MPHKTEKAIEYRRRVYWDHRRKCEALGVCFECEVAAPVPGRLRCRPCSIANSRRVRLAQSKRTERLTESKALKALPPTLPEGSPEELQRVWNEAASLRSARTRPMDPKPSRVPPLAPPRRSA